MQPFTIFAATGDGVTRIDSPEGLRFETSDSLNGREIQSVAVDPNNPQRIYAGSHNYGVAKSLDGGNTWSDAGSGIPHTRIPSMAISACHVENGVSAVFAGTEPSNLYRSYDDGDSWVGSPELPELPSSSSWSFPPRPWTHHTRWITPHATDPAVLFVGIELGGVMRSLDGGETWEDRKPGSYTDSHAIAVHGTALDRVYEAAGQGVSVSHDRGSSWSEVDSGMDRHYSWGLAVDPLDPDLWYVSASHSARYAHRSSGDAQAILYRKRGQESWQPLNGDLEQPLPYMPYSLLTLRERPDTLLAGMKNGEIWLTEDAGDSWRQLDVQLSGILQLSEAAR